MRTKFVVGLLWFLCVGCIIASAQGLHLEVSPDAQSFVLGEPVPVTIVITNSTRADQSFEDYAGSPGRSGLSLKLRHIDTGRELPFNCSAWPAATHQLGPHKAVILHKDLGKLFNIEEAGRYRVSASYEAYVTLISLVNGEETPAREKTVDVRSNAAEFTIRQVDEEKIARIKELLESGDDSEVEAALANLGEAHSSVIRSCGQAVWAAARKREGKQKDHLLQFGLAHAPLLSRSIPDDQLLSTIEYASESSNDALRLAAANALGQMKAEWRRLRPLRRFYLREVPAWLGREESADCRGALVAVLSGDISELLLKTIQHDSNPQVRLAAVRRFVQLYPSKFTEVAPTLTHMKEQVSIRGRRVSLGEVVQSELEEVQKIINADAENKEANRASKKSE